MMLLPGRYSVGRTRRSVKDTQQWDQIAYEAVGELLHEIDTSRAEVAIPERLSVIVENSPVFGYFVHVN